MQGKEYLKDFLIELKHAQEKVKFLVEKRTSDDVNYDHYGHGVLTGIALCISELECRLKETL